MTNDYDLYGIKVALNDGMMISVDNLNMVWYATPVVPNNTFVRTISFNETNCDFVYSVIVPVSNISSFVYNCIDYQGNNLLGFFSSDATFSFFLQNEQILSNYSTQDNFVIDIDGHNSGVYGFADDFIFYYELRLPFLLTVWSNMLNISPRAFDIGANVDYGIIVGYCQLTVSLAVECAYTIQLNRSLSCPFIVNEFSITDFLQFSYSDPRTNHHISQSRVYSQQTVLSASVSWRTRRVLIGIPSLNLVLLYSVDDPQNLLGSHQNGIGYMGFGKSVAWLDDQGEKAVIIANNYDYSTYQWISSYVHVYDIQSDGFSDDTQPVLIYPNSQQIIFPWMNPSFIRLVCSNSGHVAILDILGNAGIIYSTPEGHYPNTNSRFYTSITAPCIRGTYRNYSGIELCFLCPEGTYSSKCVPCLSNDSFCPSGAIEDLSYSIFESIEQDQDYPESPENTVYDDLLMEKMFSFKTNPPHCILVSPITWVFVVTIVGLIIAIGVTIHETYGPGTHTLRDWTKKILRTVDLIGEGELWIGGLVTTAVVVLCISACIYANDFAHRYPFEQVLSGGSFACNTTTYNAQFSTTAQKRPNVRSSTKDIQTIFDMLNSQLFTLNIDLIQTAFTCNDTLLVQRLISNTFKNLTISNCQTNYNNSILSLAISLPAHDITIQLALFGLKTVSAIRLGLSGPSAVSTDNRYTLMELNFASTFIPSFLDQVLAESTYFSLQLTQIINRTAPMNTDYLSTYSGIWSSSFTVNTDELFSTESRYTLYKRTYTNVTVSISESLFYISNVQEPIARRTEIIFHTLLFAILVLELFGLLFLMIKLLFVPIIHTLWNRLQYIFQKNRVSQCKNTFNEVFVEKNDIALNQKTCITVKSRRKSSNVIVSTSSIDED